jgi:hypothetical protein
MDDFRVTVNYQQYGQARAYADSIYKATMTVEKKDNGEWKPSPWADVKHFSKLVRNWTHEGKPYGKPMGECFAPHLTKFEKKSEGVYEVEVTEIYTD